MKSGNTITQLIKNFEQQDAAFVGITTTAAAASMGAHTHTHTHTHTRPAGPWVPLKLGQHNEPRRQACPSDRHEGAPQDAVAISHGRQGSQDEALGASEHGDVEV